MPVLKVICDAARPIAEAVEGGNALVREGAKLLSSAEGKALGNTATSSAVKERSARILERLFSQESELPNISRRFLNGAPDQPITEKSLYIDILSGRQLLERGRSESVNSSLFESEINGPSRLKFLKKSTALDKNHATLSLGQRVIGNCGLQTSFDDPSILWVTHVSVEDAHRGNGYASRLIESAYDYALATRQKIWPSTFEVEGRPLVHVFDRLDEIYPHAATGHRALSGDPIGLGKRG